MIDSTYIYGLFDPRDSNRVRYIGKADDCSFRLRTHINYSKSGKCNYLVNKWIRNLLSENVTPIVKPLLKIDRDIWENVERLMIAYFRIFEPNLLNMTAGGDGGSCKGRTFSKDHRLKLSLANTGKINSQERRDKISKSNKGKKVNHSKETIDKIVKTLSVPILQINRVTGEIIREFYGIKYASDVTGVGKSSISNCVRKLCPIAGGFKWRYKSKDHKIRISDRVCKMDIMSGEVLKTYESLKEAAKDSGLRDLSGISKCVKGNLKTSAGFKWKYV